MRSRLPAQETVKARVLDPKRIKKLEREIESAIAEVIMKKGSKGLLLLPSRHTMHLISKAAVTVEETVPESPAV